MLSFERFGLARLAIIFGIFCGLPAGWPSAAQGGAESDWTKPFTPD